jgi:hypothetical protein
MSKKDVLAGVRDRQSSTARSQEAARDGGGSGRGQSRDPEVAIGVKIPESLDDRIEEKVLELKRAARAEGASGPTINKRLLIRIGLEELVAQPVTELLQRLER